MDRLIFHVDVNSAYLSWEATRQVARGGLYPRTVPAAISGGTVIKADVIQPLLVVICQILFDGLS